MPGGSSKQGHRKHLKNWTAQPVHSTLSRASSRSAELRSLSLSEFDPGPKKEIIAESFHTDVPVRNLIANPDTYHLVFF